MTTLMVALVVGVPPAGAEQRGAALMGTVPAPTRPVPASQTPGVSDAAALSSTPDQIWDVATADDTSRHTRTLRALVRDLEEYDGHMYVAGKFTELVAPDGTTRDQPYLARFDLETGAWDASFRPAVSDIVYAIDITESGVLYAGGEMDGGVEAYNVATGTRLTSFQPRIANSWGPPAVFDLEVVGDAVYLAGDFTESQGTSLSNLARVNAVSGALDRSWVPTADFDAVTPLFADSLVLGLAVDAVRNRVYLAGKFGGINGDDRAAYFAALSTADGSLVPGVSQGLPPGIPNHREGFSMWMEDVQFDGDRVYVGGNGHQTMMLRASDLRVEKTHFTNDGVGQLGMGGDTQVITVGASTVWSGCHCWGSVGPFEIGSYINAADGVMSEAEYNQWAEDFRTTNPFGQQDVRAGYGLDRSTGDLVPLTFDLGGQAGAHAIAEDSNGRLWLGGQFTNVPSTGRPLSGLARFSAEPPRFDSFPGDSCATDRPGEDQILRLYRSSFGRSPDAAGLAFWTDLLLRGVPLTTIAGNFASSEEFALRYGAVTNASFVDLLYRNVLGRDGDPQGRAFWLGLLESGAADRTGVLVAISESPENINRTGTSLPLSSAEAEVVRLYLAALGRCPDEAGYGFWVTTRAGGGSLIDLAAQFVGSAEWNARYGRDSDATSTVQLLYRNVLGREPDAAGQAAWVAEIERSGVPAVLVAFSESVEHRLRRGL